MTVLKESVNHHVEEEESSLFPAFERKVSREERTRLGRALEAAKRIAPTRPHPRAPDEPPGNLLTGIPAALLDKVRDLVSAPSSGPSVTRAKGRMTLSSVMHRVARAPATKKGPAAKRSSAGRRAKAKP